MVAGRIDWDGAHRQDERRNFGRVPMGSRVEALRLDHSLDARRRPRMSMNIQDLSLNGMSASSDAPVAEGEHVSVRFGPKSALPMWDAYGRVVRCEKGPDGYRLAVEFDPKPAA